MTQIELGHMLLNDAIRALSVSLTDGNPFVVLGPELDDDDYTPAEGTGVVINGVAVGATGFPVSPGHAYTFSLDINNNFMVLAEENTAGLYYRVWDNVGETWTAWELIAIGDLALYATLSYVNATFPVIADVSQIYAWNDFSSNVFSGAAINLGGLFRVFYYDDTEGYHEARGVWRSATHADGSAPGIDYDTGDVTIEVAGVTNPTLTVTPNGEQVWCIIDPVP